MIPPENGANADGWSFGDLGAADTVPWGDDGMAVARVLATGDGYHLVHVTARAGYRGTPHPHAHTEMSYVLDGTVRSNGHELHAGGAFVAAAGSTHDDFEALTDATYLTVFKLA